MKVRHDSQILIAAICIVSGRTGAKRPPDHGTGTELIHFQCWLWLYPSVNIEREMNSDMPLEYRRALGLLSKKGDLQLGRPRVRWSEDLYIRCHSYSYTPLAVASPQFDI